MPDKPQCRSLYTPVYHSTDPPQQINVPLEPMYQSVDPSQQINVLDKAQRRSLYTPEHVYQSEPMPVLYESPKESQNLTHDVVSFQKSSNILENDPIKMKDIDIENKEHFQRGYRSDQLHGLSRPPLKNHQDILKCELKESKLKSQPTVEHSTRSPSNPKEDSRSHSGTSQDPHVNTSESDDNNSNDESTSSDSSSSSSDSSSEKSHKADSNMNHTSSNSESDSDEEQRQYKMKCRSYNKKVQKYVDTNMKLYFKQNPPPKRSQEKSRNSNVRRKHHKKRRTDRYTLNI